VVPSRLEKGTAEISLRAFHAMPRERTLSAKK
jgi:hypothetical protein